MRWYSGMYFILWCCCIHSEWLLLSYSSNGNNLRGLTHISMYKVHADKLLKKSFSLFFSFDVENGRKSENSLYKKVVYWNRLKSFSSFKIEEYLLETAYGIKNHLKTATWVVLKVRSIWNIEPHHCHHQITMNNMTNIQFTTTIWCWLFQVLVRPYTMLT